ncbi:MraY family glycosyltransferase [Legionella micdadei]|uniref:Fuc2NAc and GlcNAc transferase n=1 Tax=Legionella micdadei TaxID=451 RepID=A0A098GIT2_LEGMI|nr:glycosyltransferase family 4 protein [Legionella micdadei]ARG97161.1 glycosyl transferase [Legionella micdadei]ARH00578.1 glycosyl transferase [Legionella micdadei]KTD29240.1 alpha-N-acetylglucosaminyltransferase [Legionella micdadei]NSL17387.1 glycosyltransferase family 4 protein [Legionella micdadei]CEG61396.1 Glycosyl transferase WbpL [Legionella micdadei]
MIWLYCLLIFSLSCTLTWALRRYALATNMLDVPNHRSSHLIATPRGGGLSFVICFLLTVISLFYCNLISCPLAAALLIPGSLIAAVGFLDDRYSIPAKWRLLSHFAASGCALYLLGGMPEIPFFAWTLSNKLLTNTLAIFYLVWLLNLYNFMDGIDGIAATEAVFVCLGGVGLYYLESNLNAIYLPIGLAFAVAGFLFWNFPPARIFMGDAGSGFLGLILGILSIQSTKLNQNFFWAWMILLGVFIVDATVTLLGRVMRGEIIFEAHRSHAYQHASRYYGNHLLVTLGTLVINILWLLPIAIAVGLDFIDGGLGLLIAYLPLIFLALKFKAGQKE